MPEITRPILRYHGGKWRLASWIIEQFPLHRIYVEPFGGAASVLLQKPRSTIEVVNDLNQRLVSAFRVLRDPNTASRLMDQLRKTPYAHTEYLHCREPASDPVEDARRLIVLGFQGHGSTGASGGKLTGWRRGDRGTESTSARDWGSLHTQVMAWCDRLRNVFLECAPAVEVIRRYDGPETLFYVDPPYPASTRHPGLKSYAYEMSDAQHVELAQILSRIEGFAVVSGYACPLYDEMYGDWRRLERGVAINQGKQATEVLWLSPNISVRQLSLFCEQAC